tara:strand:+ start:1773 stop:2480 length:708 start_codon:yes stop_codon:yes gene_type:complete
VEQEFQIHTVPSVLLLEAQMPDEMVSGLNRYLDDLLEEEDRISHAGTLVGQIGHGEQLTMNHHDSRLEDFVRMSGTLAVEYLKAFGSTGNPINHRRVEVDELWSVHSYEGDYNPIHDHGTKTIMGLSCTSWTKVPQQILDQPTAGSPEYNLYNASGDADGCLAFQYGINSVIDVERLRPPQSFVIKPEIGKFLMFPSWLQHMVYPFEGEGERRTVAANFNVWSTENGGRSTREPH